MTNYCISFEEASNLNRGTYFYAAGLYPDEVFELHESCLNCITDEESFTKILGMESLYLVLGDKLCSEIVEENEQLKSYVDEYGLEEVVNSPSDRYGFRFQLCRKEQRINELLKRLGLFAIEIFSYSDSATTFLLPLKLKNKEHLKEDLETIVRKTNFYQVYVHSFNYQNIKEKTYLAGVYYNRGHELNDDDIEKALSRAGVDPERNKIFVEKTRCVDFDLKKYKLVNFSPDGCSIEEA